MNKYNIIIIVWSDIFFAKTEVRAVSIELFEHKESAYRSAALMLEEHGKAAVIHPVGTGKSFIAFRLCADNPDKTVIWLSPSEYIYKTQLENVRVASPEFKDSNIIFFTYAKLMLMPDDELTKFEPSYIILDEFHRADVERYLTALRKH